MGSISGDGRALAASYLGCMVAAQKGGKSIMDKETRKTALGQCWRKES